MLSREKIRMMAQAAVYEKQCSPDAIIKTTISVSNG